MKKIIIALAVAALAVAAHADLVNGGFSNAIVGGVASLYNINEVNQGWYTNNGTSAQWDLIGDQLVRTINQIAYAGIGQFFTLAGSGTGTVSWDAAITDSDADLDYWVQLYGYNDLTGPVITSADYLALTGMPAASNAPAGGNYSITQLGAYYHVNSGSTSGTKSFSFAADSGYEFYGIRIIANRPDAGDSFIIDNVAVVVPEPATVGMLGLGAVVALLVRRVSR